MTTDAHPGTSSARLQEVEVEALDPARLEPLIGIERMNTFERAADAAQAALAGRTILNVNSTPTGGGVAEMLQTLLAYARGVGVDTRWAVIEGDADFFAITKRIHNGLYGGPGDGGELGPKEHKHYESVVRRNAEKARPLVKPGDIVLVHDPQPAGLIATFADAGAYVVWRCHVGADAPNEWTDRAWNFIRRYVEDADAFVFSRGDFPPQWALDRAIVIPPSLDPFNAKNEPMSRRNVHLALGYVGLIAGDGPAPAVPFRRRDGSPGYISRVAEVTRSAAPPPSDAPLVVQASRWDWMKDMKGVMRAFAEHVNPVFGAHLVLAGPSVRGVADDPEAAVVFEDCVAAWHKLPPAARQRIHLACMPMEDNDEQSAMINALQRHAAIVIQKSIAEGFGLTVTEAMWKSRPVIASAVGGISTQIDDGVHGLLVNDPHDLEGCGRAINRLLGEPAYAAQIGRAARERVATEFLADRHLRQYAGLFEQMISP